MKNRTDPKVKKIFQMLVLLGVFAFVVVLMIWLIVI
jgi:hypothetical protein